jgi:hypothetical protein
MAKGKLPPLPPETPQKNAFRYKEQFGVIVLCHDEAHHQAVFKRLSGLGYKCKAVRT